MQVGVGIGVLVADNTKDPFKDLVEKSLVRSNNREILYNKPIRP